MTTEVLFKETVALLKRLIQIESISKNETKTADVIAGFLRQKGLIVNRSGNNVWVKSHNSNPNAPVILLNSHHDTVKPNTGYTLNPYEPKTEDGKLYGLGSNDAGGALVALLATFLHFYEQRDSPFNLIYAATAEEEISGKNGIESLLFQLGPIDFGIVGEPTGMRMAIAEKGLLVIDCKAEGMAGHTARNEGENAIYKAVKDIEWFRTYSFPKVSQVLGPVKMTVSMINGGIQHNITPEICTFTVDIRTTEQYTYQQILDIIYDNTNCKIEPRSIRLKPSFTDIDHPLVQAGLALGLETYGSPTLSDQALMNFKTIKIGPGDSSRSHMADEFIYLSEIREGIDTYIQLLTKYQSII